MSYIHFTLEERKYLQKLLSEGLSLRKIAAIPERGPSTISREVRRNRVRYKQKPDNPYWYNHWRARNRSIRRHREQVRAALNQDTDAWDYIIAGLQKFWSPETICGRWREENPEAKPLHYSMIYRYLSRQVPDHHTQDPFAPPRKAHAAAQFQLQQYSA